MATAAEIAVNSSNYTGDKNLGGGDFGVLKIDTKPLEQLAYYSMLFNKSEYDQRQKDADAKVDELAKLAQINLNNLVRKDKDIVAKKYTDFVTYASEFTRKNPKTHEEKLAQQLEWQTKFGELMGDYNSAKKRTVGYFAAQAEIESTYTDPADREVAKKELDRKFDTTDLSTYIQPLPEYKTESADIPKPVTSTLSVIKKGGDENIDMEGIVFIPRVNAVVADQTLLRINQTPLEGTPEFDKLSDDGKVQATMQANKYKKGGASVYASSAQHFNEVLQSKGQDGKLLYFDGETGAFLEDKFKNDMANNSPVMSAYKALKDLHTYSTDKIQQISNGRLTDGGFEYDLPTGVTADDFRAGIIDFKKGVTANQLIQAGSFAEYSGDKFQKKVTNTGTKSRKELEQIQQAGANKREAMNQAGQNSRNRDDNATQLKIAGMKKDGKDDDDLENKGVTPIKNIISSIGGVNKVTPLSSLTTAQIAAINPAWLNTAKGKEGQLTSEGKKIRISIGRRQDGTFGVYMVNKKGKAFGDMIPETTINTNAATFLAQDTKRESSGIYNYKQEDYDKAMSDVIKNNPAIPIEGEVEISSLKVNQLYSVGGKNYIWNGTKLVKAQ